MCFVCIYFLYNGLNQQYHDINNVYCSFISKKSIYNIGTFIYTSTIFFFNIKSYICT